MLFLLRQFQHYSSVPVSQSNSNFDSRVLTLEDLICTTSSSYPPANFSVAPDTNGISDEPALSALLGALFLEYDTWDEVCDSPVGSCGSNIPTASTWTRRANSTVRPLHYCIYVHRAHIHFWAVQAGLPTTDTKSHLSWTPLIYLSLMSTLSSFSLAVSALFGLWDDFSRSSYPLRNCTTLRIRRSVD